MAPPEKFDGFVELLKTTDTKQRIVVAGDLVNWLKDPTKPIHSNDIGQIIELLIPLINSSNHRVSESGIDVVSQFVQRMHGDFRGYINAVLPSVMERMGDVKSSVREACQQLILTLLDCTNVAPSQLLEKLMPLFSNKNLNSRNEMLICFNNVLDKFGVGGTKGIQVTAFIPNTVKLLGDPSDIVRATAYNVIINVYRHIGDRFKIDLQKKYSSKMQQSKLISLVAKFDEMKQNRELLQTAVIIDSGQSNDDLVIPISPVTIEGSSCKPSMSAVPTPSIASFDEPDRLISDSSRTGTGKFKRSSSTGLEYPPCTPSSGLPTSQKRSVLQSVSVKPSATSVTVTPRQVTRSNTVKRPVANTPAAGAVDEEWFRKAFEEKVDIQLYSARELDDHITKIKETISDSNIDWNRRVDAIKKVRGLVNAGATSFDEFSNHLRILVPPFQTALKDLRSQVVREACVTVSYLSYVLKNKLDHFAECLIQHLLTLIMNSAKVVASSGLVTVKFILQNVFAPRLIPIIINHATSKSKDIRKAVFEFLDMIVHIWPMHSIERHVAILQDAIRKGISDADADARFLARRAFWGFREHFFEQSESLLNSLNATQQKQLLSDCPGQMSTSSSIQSLIQPPLRTPCSVRRPTTAASPTPSPRRPVQSTRSNSAIDLQAAQRAKARAQYAALSRQKVGSGASLPRPRKITPDMGPVSLGSERMGRTRARVSGISQSQPSSRSGSPSSRLSYNTYSGQYCSVDGSSSLGFGRPRRSSTSTSTPRSTGASRETSPNRYVGVLQFGSKMRARNITERPPINPSQGRPVMAQKILQQSLEAESALAEALNLEPTENADGGVARMSSRKTSCRPFEDHSDDSETSSVCSERSYDSYRRPSDSISWSGSQQRLYRDVWETTAKDINEIIANCESTHWSDRKEGLVGLQAYLQAGNLLQPPELKRVTDNFTKMFMDSHTKVFSLFLDTLNDLIMVHRTDLNFWLYVLLTRLLNKLGGDLLGSIQNKIHKSLDVVRAYFPSDVQMSTVLRFLCDATQTPNARVKTAACNYITKLAAVTDPGLAFLPPSPGVKDTATAALTKMIGWTMGDSIKQGSELRRAAQEAIIALFNLNTPQVTLRFSLLPKEYQEAAASLIQGRVRRSSASSSGGVGGGGGGGGGGGMTGVSSPLLSPGSPTPTTVVTVFQTQTPTVNQQTHSPTLPSNYSSHIDAENLNPEEVYRSLRRTTAEIQNYSYETGCKKIDREETSQDSGISQMSSGGDVCVRSLSQHMEDLSISRSQSNRSSSTGRILTVRDCNGIDTPDTGSQGEGFNNITGQATSGSTDESEAMRKVVESLKSPVEGTDDSNSQNCLLTDQEKKIALTQLTRLIRESNCVAIMDHYKSILRVLLTQLGSNDASIRSLVLVSLTEMMKKRALADSFSNYVELLVLKVLHSFKDGTKEVQRNAEVCAATIASLLAPELVIKVLVPLITTGDYPVNLGAIKTLTKLVETRGRDPVQNFLPDLMPGLIQAYDNEESSVRKSAVFCMVALHTSVGEEQLRPHLSSLNGSKLKLLHLYIKRAQQGSSVPTSPKNQPAS